MIKVERKGDIVLTDAAGKEVSRHTDADKAIQSASANGPGKYRYTVTKEVTVFEPLPAPAPPAPVPPPPPPAPEPAPAPVVLLSRVANRISGMLIGNRNKSKGYYITEAFHDEVARINHIVLCWPRNSFAPEVMRAAHASMKARNPNLRIFQYSNLVEGESSSGQWDAGFDVRQKLDVSDWWLRNAAGEILASMVQAGKEDVNIISAKMDALGMRFAQWLAMRDYDWFFRNVPVDGWYFDNINERSRQTKPANWRQDGIDIAQPAVTDPLAAQFRQALRDWVNAAGERMPGLLRMGNTNNNLHHPEFKGAFHAGFIEAGIGKDWSLETWAGWKGLWARYAALHTNLLDPRGAVLNVYSSDAEVIRYGLCTVLLGDGMLCVTDPALAPDAYSSIPWHPDYDIRLGEPLAPAVGTQREYQGGLVLVNPEKVSIDVPTAFGTVNMAPRSGRILVR